MSIESHVIQILKNNGPLLGSELRKKIEDSLDITPDYARKVIQRTAESGGILSSKPVTFRRGQFLYYLKDQDVTGALKNAIQNNRKGLNRVIESLKHNNGLISKDAALKISAAITNSDFFPNNDNEEKILQDLTQLNVISKNKIQNEIELITEKSKDVDFFPWYRRKMINRIFTLDAIRWLEESNILAWNSGEVFNEFQKCVHFNGQLWDVIGFTYLYGHFEKRYQNNQPVKTPSLVFIESIFHRTTYIEDIEGFVTRIEMQSARMKNVKDRSKILPILFYRYLTPEAFELAKSKGILLYSVTNWLGRYAKDLIETMINPKGEYNKINKYIEILSIQGLTQSNIYNELFKIKHSISYINKGWVNRRHLNYKTIDERIHVDWIMFDSTDTPHLCMYVSKELSIRDEIIEEYLTYTYPTVQRIRKETTGEIDLEWMIFNEKGLEKASVKVD